MIHKHKKKRFNLHKATEYRVKTNEDIGQRNLQSKATKITLIYLIYLPPPNKGQERQRKTNNIKIMV